MELAQTRRGEYVDMRFIGPERVAITYNVPLAEVLARRGRGGKRGVRVGGRGRRESGKISEGVRV
jgi:hypothetical protein